MSPLHVEFAYFLPVVLALYWLGTGRAWWQNAVALAASYGFFASWSPALLWVIIGSSLMDHIVAPLIAPEAAARARRPLYWLGLGVNLGALAYFKYEGFFAASLNQVAGTSLPVAQLLAPIGISFWTLQKLGYLIDVHHGRVAPCRSLLAYATWVAFFPQLLAGPIARARDVLPQFLADRRPQPDQFMAGAADFLLGFFMKAYVASSLASALADPAFAGSTDLSRMSHWAGLLAYAGQLFCDFAGYSLVAIGTGKLLGITLPINFNYPFLSRNLPEVWRRWHISLNTWLFDYLFVPLTTGRGVFRHNLPAAFIVVFLLSGLWHGARWTFVLWGLLQGLGLCIHFAWDEGYKRLCRGNRAWVARRRSPAYQTVAWFATQAFFVLTLIPFRAPSLAAAEQYTRGLVAGAGGTSLNLRSGQLVFCAAFLALYHLAAFRPGGALNRRFAALPAPMRGVAFGLVVVFLLLFAPVGAGTFIYAQF